MSALRSGEIVAGGLFVTALNSQGGIQLLTNRIARWSDTGIPGVAAQPVAQTAAPGAAVTLSATCATGYDVIGPVAFQWRRNGVSIVDGPGGASLGGGTVSGSSGTLSFSNPSVSLTISGIRPSDAGSYSVAFTNSCGSASSSYVLVAVPNGCLGDLNGDRGVNGADLGLLLGSWGGAQFDLNGDGVVTGADLGILLGAWGTCP
jgi:hypothetical protein